MAAFLIMSGLMIGAFAALDAMLFYVFFEGMLIPMYLIIGVWVVRAVSMRPSSSSCTPCSARC
jgi:NADH:ubiquinone oxidoreductase subunit 4 (subunit M)